MPHRATHAWVRRHVGFHPNAAFRPWVFATLRRFSPQDASWAYFIPLARPGFSLQGFSLVRSSLDSSSSACPLVVTGNLPPVSRRAVVDPTSGPSSPHESVASESQLRDSIARSPPGLSPLQSLLPAGRGFHFGTPPLSSFACEPYETFASCSTGSFRAGVWVYLSRGNQLS